MSNGVDQSLAALKHELASYPSLTLSLPRLFILIPRPPPLSLPFSPMRIITSELSSTRIIIIDRSMAFVHLCFPSLLFPPPVLVRERRADPPINGVRPGMKGTGAGWPRREGGGGLMTKLYRQRNLGVHEDVIFFWCPQTIVYLR